MEHDNGFVGMQVFNSPFIISPRYNISYYCILNKYFVSLKFQADFSAHFSLHLRQKQKQGRPTSTSLKKKKEGFLWFDDANRQQAAARIEHDSYTLDVRNKK